MLFRPPESPKNVSAAFGAMLVDGTVPAAKWKLCEMRKVCNLVRWVVARQSKVQKKKMST